MKKFEYHISNKSGIFHGLFCIPSHIKGEEILTTYEEGKRNGPYIIFILNKG